jgi:hypothetical protein
VLSVGLITALGGGSDPSLVNGVSSAEFQAYGLDVRKPEGSPAATVSQQEAEKVALSYFPYPGGKIKQSVLAQVAGPLYGPPLDGLMWVVSLDPGTFPDVGQGPPGAPVNYATKYALVFIDAQTGNVVMTKIASVPTGGPQETSLPPIPGN